MKKIVAAMLMACLTLGFGSAAFAAKKKADPKAACEKIAVKKKVPADQMDSFIADCMEKKAAKKAKK